MPQQQPEILDYNGDKFYTGNLVPETYPLSFKPYPETYVRSLSDIAEIVKNKKRRKSTERWGADKLINQGQRSSCNAYMAAAILMRCLDLSFNKWIPVAPEFIYMHINGNKDEGSMLADGMEFVADTGCCKKKISGEELIPYQSYRTRDISMEHLRVATDDAKDQRFGECYQFPNDSVEKCWQAMLSALAGDGICGVAVHVGRNYMRSSVVAGFDSGPGNHAVCVDDIVLLNENPKSIEDFQVKSPQSWGTKFADGGWTNLTYKHVQETMRYHALYACRSVPMSRDDYSQTRIKD